MSYNSLTTAKDIVGADLNQTILDVATSLIHAHTPFRWATTSVTRRFSGDGRNVVWLRMPVTTFTSLYEIDEEDETNNEALTIYDDFEYDKETGRLENYLGFTVGYNNYEVKYAYGYDSSNAKYHTVLYIEAAVALLLKKNPLLLASVNLAGGDKVDFRGTADGDALWQILKNVPRPLQTVAL